MRSDEFWMERCLQLALNGSGQVAPNPMVGAVLVSNDEVLAEGWHRAHGQAHAEVECLRAFGDGTIPADAVLYVNLEPCAHHGLTPPCADMLVARGVKNLVVGCGDPNPLTNGKGTARARAAGVRVRDNIIADRSRWINRRFMTSFELGRPYVILKWAQSSDGFLDGGARNERGPLRISSPATDVLVHTWRAQEQAIMVGSRTALNDDPRLDVRHVQGRSPLRVLLDRRNSVPASSRVFGGAAPTLLISSGRRSDVACDQLVLGKEDKPLTALLEELQRRNIRSLLVEGGAELLRHFIAAELWDEARVITGDITLRHGTAAPPAPGSLAQSDVLGNDRINYHVRVPSAVATWPS